MDVPLGAETISAGIWGVARLHSAHLDRDLAGGDIHWGVTLVDHVSNGVFVGVLFQFSFQQVVYLWLHLAAVVCDAKVEGQRRHGGEGFHDGVFGFKFAELLAANEGDCCDGIWSKINGVIVSKSPPSYLK